MALEDAERLIDTLKEKAEKIRARAHTDPPFYISEDSLLHLDITRVIKGVFQLKMDGFRDNWEGLVTDECLRGMLYTKGKIPVAWMPEGFNIRTAKITEQKLGTG